eukprot:15437404-Alexandrium_andersonii.AAC.1
MKRRRGASGRSEEWRCDFSACVTSALGVTLWHLTGRSFWWQYYWVGIFRGISSAVVECWRASQRA